MTEYELSQILYALKRIALSLENAERERTITGHPGQITHWTCESCDYSLNVHGQSCQICGRESFDDQT